MAPRMLVAATIMSAGTCITGPTVSLTVTVKLAVAEVPWASPAGQVTRVRPMGNVEPEAGEQLTATGPSTASVAVGEGQVTGEPASAVTPAGMLARTGGVVSWTVTVKDPLVALPWLSAALQLTMLVPRAKTDPLAGLQLAATAPSTRSTALAWYWTAAPAALVASAVNAVGSASRGAVVSSTVTENPADAVLPCASV